MPQECNGKLTVFAQWRNRFLYDRAIIRQIYSQRNVPRYLSIIHNETIIYTPETIVISCALICKLRYCKTLQGRKLFLIKCNKKATLYDCMETCKRREIVCN